MSTERKIKKKTLKNYLVLDNDAKRVCGVDYNFTVENYIWVLGLKGIKFGITVYK